MKKYIALFLALVLMLGVLAGCGSTSTDTNPPSNNNTPSAPSDGDKPDDATPATPDDTGAFSPRKDKDGKVVINIGMDTVGRLIEGTSPLECNPATYLLYDQIFTLDPWTKGTTSDCLKEWYWEDDTTLIMVLRDNVYFSNGDHATAEDVLFSYQNLEDRGSTFTDDMYLDLAHSEVRDDVTLAMKFTQPSVQIFRHYISLYDKKWCEAQGDWESEAFNNPVGSGPYKCVKYVYNDNIVMQLRDDYWNADESDPFIVDEFNIKRYPDATAMMMALETGDIDLCTGTASDYSRYYNLSSGEKDKLDYALCACPSGVTEYIGFDLKGFDGLWRDNLNLRRAIAYCLDLDSVGVYINGEELNNRTYGFATQGTDYYFEAGKYEYNPEYAKQLLDEAGIDPTTITVKATMMSVSMYQNFAQAVQYYLEQMGFKVEFEYADVTAALSSWKNEGQNSFNLFYNAIGITAYDATSTMLNAAKEGTPWQYINDAKFQELYAECLNAHKSNEELVQANHELQQYIWDNCLAIPISEKMGVFAYNKEVFNEAIINAISFSGYFNTDGCIHASDWQK